jgi:hypothetical protein
MEDIEFLIKVEMAAAELEDNELAAEARRRMGKAPKANIKKMNDEMELLLNDVYDELDED